MLSTLRAMRSQETAYRRQDYLAAFYDKESSEYRAVADDRSKMVDWATKLVNFANLSRETVEIAMSYTDRFLQTEEGQEYLGSASRFQLLVIVSLFLALKTHGSSAYISLGVFRKISRGQYDIETMLSMESKLLQVLDWRMNPPTTTGFMHLFLELVPSVIMDDDMKSTALFLSQVQAEYALHEYDLVATTRPSTVALAALKNSLEALGVDDGDTSCITTFIQEQTWGELDDLNSLQTRLYGAIYSHTYSLHLPRHTKSNHQSYPTKNCGDCHAKSTKARIFREESNTPRSAVSHHHDYNTCSQPQ
mgnify:CR=1 FL=1